MEGYKTSFSSRGKTAGGNKDWAFILHRDVEGGIMERVLLVAAKYETGRVTKDIRNNKQQEDGHLWGGSRKRGRTPLNAQLLGMSPVQRKNEGVLELPQKLLRKRKS